MNRISRGLSRAILVLAPLVSSCDSPYSTFRPGGGDAQMLYTLGLWLCGIALLITLGMAILVVWGALRRRGSLDEHLPVGIDGGKRWILIGGLAIPGVALSALFVVTLLALGPFSGDADEADLELEVIAHRWWWEVNYVTAGAPSEDFVTANEIHIPVGRRVGITLRSADVIHSFWVPRLHGKLDAIPGIENRLVLQADEPGTYHGQCAEYCGGQHAFMHFLIVAQAEEEYEAWAARQRQPAVTPQDPVLARGLAAFEQHACSSCHRVRGTEARGTNGPDLTHFGSRMTIGAGIMPNNRPRLQAWIVDAQAIKPGINMPTLTEFDGPTIDALASYLESLQ